MTEEELIEALAERIITVAGSPDLGDPAVSDHIARECLRQMKYAAQSSIKTVDLTTSGRAIYSRFNGQLAPEDYQP